MAICPEHYDEMSRRLRADAAYSLPELAWFIEMCVAAKLADGSLAGYAG